MDPDAVAKALHDKATRGETLSAEERACLENWYARQDQAENALLAGTPAPLTLAALQAKVEVLMTQLLTVTQRLQALTAAYEVLRREVAALQRQLTSRKTGELLWTTTPDRID